MIDVLKHPCAHPRWHRESVEFAWLILDAPAAEEVPLLWPEVLGGLECLAERQPEKAREVVLLLGQERTAQRAVARDCMALLQFALDVDGAAGGKRPAYAAAFVSLAEEIDYGLRRLTSEDLGRAERVAEEFPRVRSHLLPSLKAYVDGLASAPTTIGREVNGPRRHRESE